MTDIRVAIIEDHDLIRAGLDAALQRCDGLDVVGDARNGIQGLRLLETTQPDVAIVDGEWRDRQWYDRKNHCH